jgi:hypothetical protein
LFAAYNCYSYYAQPYLIHDPDSSLSLSCIWSWFFPVTVLYMILNLPRHCIIYDPDSSPSLSYIWSWFFLVMHCLIYDPDSSPSLSYIWQKIIEIFPLFITYSFYRSWDIYILRDNVPCTGKNQDIDKKQVINRLVIAS